MFHLRGQKRGGARAAGYAALLMAAAGLAAMPLPAAAQAGDRWAADETEARASLPPPAGNAGVTGAELTCAAQRWRLEIALAGAVAAGEGEAVLRVDANAFPARAAAADGVLTVAVPRAAIEPLKRGLRLTVELPEALAGPVGDLAFGLRGSNVAITAVESRCTLRDMSAYRLVEFASPSAYDTMVRELRADDIKAFSDATASQPEMAAAMAVFEEGGRVLFTRLCGSSWYFGLSGCNITGFVRGDDSEAGWRAVYDTENVVIHTDPRSANEGWPDLATLPVRAGGVALRWRWDGSAYALAGELPEEEEGDELAMPLRPGHD